MQKGPCCGKPEAKAHRVVRAGEPAGSVKRRGRPTVRSDASCGTTPDRGEAASSRLHRPDHLAPHPTAFVRSLLEADFYRNRLACLRPQTQAHLHLRPKDGDLPEFRFEQITAAFAKGIAAF